MAALRFATIGTSDIAEQFLRALSTVKGARLVGCYSRELDRAREFGRHFGATHFYDDLSELAADPAVDAVYIASPNGLHASQALQLVEGGKHVLVEKPFAANEREARDVFDAARSAGVVALEAVRSLHVPAFATIERVVREDLGPVRIATFRFSKVTSRISRLRAGERLNVFDPALAGGALMDIGVYCVEPAIALFGPPDEVRCLSVLCRVPGAGERDPFSVIDLAGEIILGYHDKVVSLSYGKVSDDRLSSQIEGEHATLLWDQVSCPSNLRVHEHVDRGMIYRMGSDPLRSIDVLVPDLDMACEIEDFVSAVRGDVRGVALRDRFESVTLDSLAVMDEARRASGVLFPSDALPRALS